MPGDEQAERAAAPAGPAGLPVDPDGLYRALVETAGDIIAFLDAEGLITYVSPAVQETLGFEPGEVVGRRFDELVDPGNLDLAKQIFGELVAGKSQLRREITVRDRRGDPVRVLVNARPLIGPDGVEGIVAVVADISELDALRRRLERQAGEDDLTGLANRRRFREELDRHLAHGERYGWRGALLLLDVDHLKEVNDTCGHPAGDRLLTQVAGRLRKRLRRSDLLARLGGDEFAVLLQEANETQALIVAEAVVGQIAGTPFRVNGGLRSTMSVGVAVIDGPTDTDDVMHRADDALYEAKRQGGDCAARSPAQAAGRPEGARRGGTGRFRHTTDDGTS